jgi:hypothetical protein
MKKHVVDVRLRLPVGVHHYLKRRAVKNKLSLNAQLVGMLEHQIFIAPAVDEKLDEVRRLIAALPDVVTDRIERAGIRAFGAISRRALELQTALPERREKM